MKIEIITILIFAKAIKTDLVCNGGDITTINPACTIIIDQPIVVNFQKTNAQHLKTLKGIKKVYAGMRIVSFPHEIFDGMENLVELSNVNITGPTLIFEGGLTLQGFAFKSLTSFTGSIHFINNHYPISVQYNRMRLKYLRQMRDSTKLTKCIPVKVTMHGRMQERLDEARKDRKIQQEYLQFLIRAGWAAPILAHLVLFMLAAQPISQVFKHRRYPDKMQPV